MSWAGVPVCGVTGPLVGEQMTSCWIFALGQGRDGLPAQVHVTVPLCAFRSLLPEGQGSHRGLALGEPQGGDGTVDGSRKP